MTSEMNERERRVVECFASERAAIATPPASHDAGDEFAKLRGSERHANYAETRYWCEQYRLFGSKAVDTIATLTAEVERLTGELEEAQRQRLPEGYITIPCEAWDAQMKIEGELERSRQECEGLREQNKMLARLAYPVIRDPIVRKSGGVS